MTKQKAGIAVFSAAPRAASEPEPAQSGHIIEWVVLGGAAWLLSQVLKNGPPHQDGAAGLPRHRRTTRRRSELSRWLVVPTPANRAPATHCSIAGVPRRPGARHDMAVSARAI